MLTHFVNSLSFSLGLLAQVRKSDTTQIIIWTGAVILLLFGATILILFIKRKLASGDTAAAFSAGSMLEELRTMHAAGKISDEEYAKARAKLGGKLRTQPMPGGTTQDAKPGTNPATKSATKPATKPLAKPLAKPLIRPDKGPGTTPRNGRPPQ